MKGVIQVLVECNYGKNLPDKKDIEKENRFNTVVEENFLDYLEKLNYLQREAIIKKIERKIKNSNEGRSYEEIIL